MNIETIRELFNNKQWQTCIEACLKLIMKQRTNIEAWSLCAFCYSNIGHLQEAIKCLEDALNIAKKHHKEHIFMLSLNLAEFYRRNNMTLQAIALLQNLLPRDDENLHFNLAKCYGDLQDYERSIQHYMIAIKINPKDIHAIFNLANQQAAIGSFKLALKYYSLAYESGMGDAGINLAQIYTNLDDLKSAITLYKELEPYYKQDSNFYFNYANALRYNNDVELAKETYNRAISLNPDVRYIINLAHLCLSVNDFQVGFALYEYRRVMLPKTMDRYFLDFSFKDSKDILKFLRDKKVALYHEQGFGDSIMFARFLPLLSCKEKIIFAPKELCRIFSCFDVPCDSKVHDDYDVALPLPSLAFLFANKKVLKTSLESFKNILLSFLMKSQVTDSKNEQHIKDITSDTIIYANNTKAQVSVKKVLTTYQHYTQKEEKENDVFLTLNTQTKNHLITNIHKQNPTQIQVLNNKKPIKVALNFSSNPNFQNAREKSIYARKLLESLPHKGFTYYSLQYEGIDSSLAKEFGIIDMSKNIKDFYDSAKILLTMDVVVSIDSALAHLSATLGIPTALLLYKRHDWRWGNFCKHDSTIWYGNAKLFIQEYLNEWRSVLENLNNFLCSFVKT